MTTYHEPRYYPAIIYVDRALLSQTLVERDTAEFGKHPVITSFLALKWSRISVHYNTNLIFSAVLVSLLTLYIFTNYAGEKFF